MNKGRQLPRTNTILQNENAALRNKVKSLEEALEAAYNIMKDLYDSSKAVSARLAEVTGAEMMIVR